MAPVHDTGPLHQCLDPIPCTSPGQQSLAPVFATNRRRQCLAGTCPGMDTPGYLYNFGNLDISNPSVIIIALFGSNTNSRVFCLIWWHLWFSVNSMVWWCSPWSSPELLHNSMLRFGVCVGSNIDNSCLNRSFHICLTHTPFTF